MFSFFKKKKIVPHIKLSGVIGNVGKFKQGIDFAGQEEVIKKAFSVKKAIAVAVTINSPGGSPVQSHLIYKFIREQAQKKKLKVIVFAEDVAASGGYWLACAADEIYADANSIVGSIGVISSGFGFQDAIQRLGVERRVYSQGKHKAILDPFKAEDPEGVEMLMGIQKEIYEGFKLHVRERRGKRLAEESEQLFGGDVWTGKRALELGLIDGLGDLYSVTRERFGEEVKIRFVDVPKKWFRRRLGLEAGFEGNGSFQDNFVEKLWHQLETRSLWSKYGL